MTVAAGGHYGLAAVSRSLQHFLLGKGVAMICAFGVLFLLARLLDTPAYAFYVSLQAVVLLIGRVSGLGLQKAMLRYLPELRATGNHFGAYRLLWRGTLLRATLLALATGAALLALPLLGRAFGLEQWLWLVPWYLLLGWLRLINQWIAAMLESFLWQKQAQYPVAAGALLRLGGVLLLGTDLDLQSLLLVELVAEAVVALLLIHGWRARRRADPERCDGDWQWWTDNRSRVLRFGFWAFLQNQCGLFYGSAPNRLVAAHLLPSAEVALFGLADNLINLVRRFMPTQLFIGLIRPVALARFSTRGKFSQVAWVAGLAFRLNLALLTLGAALMISVGEPLFDWLTGGKYPAAAWLVAGLLALTAVEGLRAMVELMAQAVEGNQSLFVSNLIQSASLLLAIPLVPVIGLWALVGANILGTLLANLWLLVRLRRDGHSFSVNPKRTGMIAAYGIGAALTGSSLAVAGVHFVAAGAAVVVLYGGLCLWKPPLQSDERKTLLRVIRPKAAARAEQVLEAD